LITRTSFAILPRVQRTFLHFARIVPRTGCIVLNGDDDNLRALGPAGRGRGRSGGTAKPTISESQIFPRMRRRRISNCSGAPALAGDSLVAARTLQCPQRAMAAIAAGLMLDPANPTALQLGALARFRGVQAPPGSPGREPAPHGDRRISATTRRR